MLILGAYAASLTGRVRARYEQKVAMCGSVDPLLLDDGDTLVDVNLYPRVETTDIKDYLVNGTSFYSREQFKASKSLEAHNYLTSGWVSQPRLKVLPDKNVVCVAKVSESVTAMHFWVCVAWVRYS